jgi:puromycin-sensitive aminopeptidase
MSTYLVAFVVGEFDYVEERSTDGVLVRVYTPVGKKEQGRFGLYAPAKLTLLLVLEWEIGEVWV